VFRILRKYKSRNILPSALPYSKLCTRNISINLQLHKLLLEHWQNWDLRYKSGGVRTEDWDKAWVGLSSLHLTLQPQRCHSGKINKISAETFSWTWQPCALSTSFFQRKLNFQLVRLFYSTPRLLKHFPFPKQCRVSFVCKHYVFI